MLGAIGRTVSRLMRVRYGPLALPPGLKRGQLRELVRTRSRTWSRQLKVASPSRI